jgi:hypothetical protein
MRCEEAQRQVALQRYGEPVPEAVTSHVSQCQACRQLVVREARLDALLSVEVDEPPRPGFDTRFFARLDAHKRARSGGGAWRWLWLLAPLAAGAAIAFIRIAPAPPRDVSSEDLALAMEHELLEDLPLLQQLDEVEAYDVLSQLSDEELAALARQVSP